MLYANKKEQTPSEFNEHFKDVLECYVKKLFKPKDILLFVTYQPHSLEFDPNAVLDVTKHFFGSYPFVEVLEQTFKTSNRYNYSNYIDGYHSHLIIKESDYDLVKDQLKDLDIVTKVIYDLEGLIKRYLSKQAGIFNDRKDPIINNPDICEQSVLKTELLINDIQNIEPITIQIIALIRFVEYCFKPDCENALYLFKTMNKLWWLNVFIDDT